MSELLQVSGIEPALLVALVTAVFAICATIIALCAVWIATVAARRNAVLRVEHEALQHEIQARLKMVDRCSIGMGETLTRLESRLNQSVSEDQNPEPANVSSLAHEQLNKLVDMGANVDELVDRCGMSKAEAELLLLLNSARRNSRVSVPEH